MFFGGFGTAPGQLLHPLDIVVHRDTLRCCKIAQIQDPSISRRVECHKFPHGVLADGRGTEDRELPVLAGLLLFSTKTWRFIGSFLYTHSSVRSSNKVAAQEATAMDRLHAAAGVAVLLFAFVNQSSKAWGGNDAPHDQVKSSHFSSLRTYSPTAFQPQSRVDRLSGGLTQGFPFRMAADSQGRILVTDPLLSVVHVFDTRQARRWQIRGDRRHRLIAPAHIAVDADDNIYLTDLGRSVVFVLQPDGHFLRTIGRGILGLPTSMWLDKNNRRLYIADWIRDEILEFDLEGKLLQVFGSFGTAPGQLLHPLDIVVHRDTLVVLDAGNSRFELFDLQGKVRGIWPYGPDRTPVALACDAAGNLYYSDVDSGGLIAMDSQGKVLAGFGQRPFGQWVPRSSAGLNFMSLALDPTGKILALRPTLEVEVLELISETTG